MSDGNKPLNPDRGPRGQFLPGNSIAKLGGRPVSSRQKLAEAFFRDLQAAWEANGPDVLRQVVDKQPGDLMRAVAGLMPKELSVEVTNQEDALKELDADTDEPTQ